jgi:FtsP/CotA-like multicopper oxidase with cupredoxin domain
MRRSVLATLTITTASIFLAGCISSGQGEARRARDSESGLRGAERVQPNDNVRVGGTMRGGVLELQLEARAAIWHPDGDDAPGALMPAFAEVGGVAQIPGPLLRVRSGTEAYVSVRNTLRDTLLVYGLHARLQARPTDATPIAIAPGERRTARFRLDAPGTYYYWGTTMRRAVNFRTLEDAQLTGAIVVDDPAAGSPRDRVLVMGMWTDTVHRALTHRQRVLGVINGRSWPHTERLHHTVGDSVRWRLINASADLHPMHLHGFYFRVDSRGDGQSDSVYAAGAGGMAVTESMSPGATMSLTWVPERPGNWLYHCHIPEHFSGRGSLGVLWQAFPPVAAGEPDLRAHANHAKEGMNGLVLGIEVRPARTTGPAATAPGNERHIRLLVRPNVGNSAATPFYGYALHERGVEPPPDSGLGVGPTLDLARGQPVRITIVNRLAEPTAVHWHGIELDSYFDGVPGFSGVGSQVTPLILPADSFEVHFTPPRAGTFIYHTHADEERQQLAGLAGALVVAEPQVPRDPATDIPILITAPSEFAEQGRSALVNGDAAPEPIEMRVGTTYRLRLIQMSASRAALRVEVWRDSTPAVWRPIAKDGADLPPAARGSRPARTFMGIGETYDVEITPEAVGTMRLEVRLGPPWPAPSVPLATLPITVRPAEAQQRR